MEGNYPIEAVANAVLSEAESRGISLSPMKLQKWRTKILRLGNMALYPPPFIMNSRIVARIISKVDADRADCFGIMAK
jgi:hypothetical protein